MLSKIQNGIATCVEIFALCDIRRLCGLFLISSIINIELNYSARIVMAR